MEVDTEYILQNGTLRYTRFRNSDVFIRPIPDPQYDGELNLPQQLINKISKFLNLEL